MLRVGFDVLCTISNNSKSKQFVSLLPLTNAIYRVWLCWHCSYDFCCNRFVHCIHCNGCCVRHRNTVYISSLLGCLQADALIIYKYGRLLLWRLLCVYVVYLCLICVWIEIDCGFIVFIIILSFQFDFTISPRFDCCINRVRFTVSKDWKHYQTPAHLKLIRMAFLVGKAACAMFRSYTMESRLCNTSSVIVARSVWSKKKTPELVSNNQNYCFWQGRQYLEFTN